MNVVCYLLLGYWICAAFAALLHSSQIPHLLDNFSKDTSFTGSWYSVKKKKILLYLVYYTCAIKAKIPSLFRYTCYLTVILPAIVFPFHHIILPDFH